VDPNRERNGHFAKGNRASPGRPKGQPNFRTLFLELPDDEEEARAEVAQTLVLTAHQGIGPSSLK
jgi:hypothetical protein